MPQNNHFVALRDKLLRFKLQNVLSVSYQRKEFSDTYTPGAFSAKRHMFQFRQLPLDVSRVQIQERLYVAAAHKNSLGRYSGASS
ncbi:hypothetical protein BH24ACI4_BH24ACI4_21680 [soil metagenome]